MAPGVKLPMMSKSDRPMEESSSKFVTAVVNLACTCGRDKEKVLGELETRLCRRFLFLCFFCGGGGGG